MFKSDRDQLGKGIQNLGFGGFSVHFWAAKSEPRGSGARSPRFSHRPGGRNSPTLGRGGGYHTLKSRGVGARSPHIVTTRNIAPSPAEPAKPAFDQRYFYEMVLSSHRHLPRRPGAGERHAGRSGHRRSGH